MEYLGAVRIAENLKQLEERIASACHKAGRPRAAVQLLAVSKFNPPEAVAAAWAAGQRLFGENRVQEAQTKFPSAALPGAKVHLLGHLQSNKAKKAVELFDCIQSVDSLSILRELSKQAVKLERSLDILLELHTGEESKSGFADEASLLDALDLAASLPGLRPRGLMTMAPYTTETGPIRASFTACRQAMDRAVSRFGLPEFDILSMGMTNDFELAIAEGSTLLRVGTAIFGSRQQP